MNRHRRPRWTVEEFLEWDTGQNTAHEYVGGMIRTPLVDTRLHTVLEANIRKEIAAQLKPPCRLYEDHERVVTAVSASYPDVAVTCGESPNPDRPQPKVIVEVLARRTEVLDRVHKWIAVQALESLAHYVLVCQDRARTETISRTADGWQERIVTSLGASLELPAIGISIPMTKIYIGTTVFPA